MSALEAVHFCDAVRLRKWVILLLFVDEALLGVDKHAGLPVIAERGHAERPCLQHILHQRCQEKLSTVQRIDAGTSGVVLFARTAIGDPLVVDPVYSQRQASYLATIKTENQTPHKPHHGPCIKKQCVHPFLRIRSCQ